MRQILIRSAFAALALAASSLWLGGCSTAPDATAASDPPHNSLGQPVNPTYGTPLPGSGPYYD
jgi:hypothetical protein